MPRDKHFVQQRSLTAINLVTQTSRYQNMPYAKIYIWKYEEQRSCQQSFLFVDGDELLTNGIARSVL